MSFHLKYVVFHLKDVVFFKKMGRFSLVSQIFYYVVGGWRRIEGFRLPKIGTSNRAIVNWHPINRRMLS